VLPRRLVDVVVSAQPSHGVGSGLPRSLRSREKVSPRL